MADLINKNCRDTGFSELSSLNSQQNKKVLLDNRERNPQANTQNVQLKQKLITPPNNTGLPDNLKSGMENLSGVKLDDVRVHYNSPKPAAVQAHAYAQGNDIHLASGQEKHLPHELGHVVQQAQGRVRPTMTVGGVQVNDNPGLENEATLMGEKALQMTRQAKAIVKPTKQMMGRGNFNYAADQEKEVELNTTTGKLSQNSIQKKSVQLTSYGQIYQFNKEKALWALGGAVVTGLGAYLLSIYNERQARLRQEQIIAAFDQQIAEAGFIDNAQVRENTFVRTALQRGVSEEVARALFNESGAAQKDVVTGYDVPGDRKPSVRSAINYIQEHLDARGYYVEVDIRNLGGLNSVLGHNGADKLFKLMTDISAASVESLRTGKVKVAKFRHGGDEFSFLILAEDGSVSPDDVNAVLHNAASEIKEMTLKVPIGEYNPEPTGDVLAESPIASIEHPKHKGDKKYFGTGIVYGIGQILGTDANEDVAIEAADLQVEAKKK